MAAGTLTYDSDSNERKTHLPNEVRAKRCHYLLILVYFLHTFARIGRKCAKNILNFKVDGALSLSFHMVDAFFFRKMVKLIVGESSWILNY